MKPTIALCMIIKNEERCIGRCLDSIVDKVDEVIIVDTGSTDRTLEFIGKYDRIKLFHYQWNNHFADARNFALDQATSDYILQLDADEWIDDREEIFLKHLDKEIYYISIRNELGAGLAEVHRFPRLFRNIPELRYEGAIHEQINLNIHGHRSSEILSGVLIHHDGYLHHIKKEKNKNTRNLDILLRECKESPNIFSWYNLGHQYFSMDDYKNALQAFKKAYSYSGEYTFTKRLLLGIIQSLMGLEEYKDALSIASDAAQLYPDYVEFKYYEGLLYQNLGYIPDAMACFQQCIDQGDSSPQAHFSTYEGTGSYLAYARMSELSHLNFDFPSSEYYLKQAITQAPLVMGLFKNFLILNNGLSGPQLFSEVITIWPQKVEVLQQLIAGLYKLRHPLLLDFFNAYSMEMDQKVMAFLDLLQGNYEAASIFWNGQSNIEAEDGREARVLSLFTSNQKLARRSLDILSISENEKSDFVKLINGETNLIKQYSEGFQEIVYDLICDIIKLERFELLDDLIKKYKSSQMRYIFSKALYDYGYYNLVLEVMIEGSNAAEQYDINLLIAKTLRILEAYEDSLYYYVQAFKIKGEPEVAFQICKLADQLNDRDTLQFVFGEMLQWEIKSKWVQQQIN